MHLLSSELTKTEMDKKDILTTDWSDSSLNNPSFKSPILLAAAFSHFVFVLYIGKKQYVNLGMQNKYHTVLIIGLFFN